MNSNLHIISSFRKDRRTWCKVKCTHCKNTSIMRQDIVKKAKSCGCMNYVKKLDKLAPYRRLLQRYKKTATDRNLSFELNFNEFKNLISDKCFYCGNLPSSVICTTKGKKKDNCIAFNGIDRIDNTEGYVTTNVTTCCGVCNFMKWNLSQDQFIERVQKISANISAQYKLCELLENLEKDNQQPSFAGNSVEGSTTRSESLVDNNSSKSAGRTIKSTMI